MQKKELKTETDVAQLICADCGLPIAGEKARTDVTRYLADSSRCQCRLTQTSPDGVDSSQTSGERETKLSKAKLSFSIEEAQSILDERFQVMEILGQGGMGTVVKAKEKASDKTFAVKLLNPQLIDDKSSVKRFEQEAKAAMMLTHAHLAAVYEYGIGKDDTPFLVMDLLEGKTLDQMLKAQNRLSQRQAIDIFIQICEALEHTHNNGLIHRDIKPSNIMVSTKNGIDYAKLFDFGIAKVLPNQTIDLTGDITQTGDLFGSPMYMSPEQCKGLDLDARTDIYSLGCVMYKTLTGQHPFEGKNFVDTIIKIVTTEAKAPSLIHPADYINKDLDRVVEACLRKDVKDRYQNARELKKDLECLRDNEALSSPTQQRSTQRKKKSEKAFSSPKTQVVTYGLLGILLATFFATIYKVMNSAPPAVPAQQNATPAPVNPYKDAERLDQLSYTYFVKGKYEQAIPLLEFGIKTYKENGRRNVGAGREDSYLAENYSHLGKCYLKLGKFKEAVAPYRESLRIFSKWGKYPGGMMPEAVNDYAEVLRNLGATAKADEMLTDFETNQNLTSIPSPD